MNDGKARDDHDDVGRKGSVRASHQQKWRVVVAAVGLTNNYIKVFSLFLVLFFSSSFLFLFVFNLRDLKFWKKKNLLMWQKNKTHLAHISSQLWPRGSIHYKLYSKVTKCVQMKVKKKPIVWNGIYSTRTKKVFEPF